MNDKIIKLLEDGYGYQQQGRMDLAEKKYQKVLKKDANNIHALNLLGVVSLSTEQPKKAVEYISQAIKIEPADAEAHANLGLAYKDSKRFQDAKKSLQKAIQLNPSNPVTHNNLGNVLAALNEEQAATESFQQALKLDPGYLGAMSNLGAALKKTGQLDAALRALDHALKLKPDFAEAWNNRGEVLFKQARFNLAVASYERALQEDPEYTDAKINLSAGLKEVGKIEAAQKVLMEVVEQQPDNSRAFNNLGVLFEQLGDGENAAGAFRQAIELSPDYGNAWYQLAQLKGEQLTESELQRLLELLQRDDLLDKQRMPLAFALACAYENRDDYDNSFHYLNIAQELKSAENPYDNEQVKHYYSRIGQSSYQLVDAVENQTAPVFVLGMPRSGTSLTEQILDSHPAISGAGELSFMEDIIARAKRIANSDYPECVSNLSMKDLAQLGGDYWQRLSAAADFGGYIVDKTPMNFQYIGFIASMMPHAKFLHCKRDPIDNCLSIYKLPFETSHSYAHDLQALGQYYRHYEALMEHWLALLGDRILEVQYEEMVADVEQQSRRMLEFLGLPYDPAVLDFHKTERIVKTPSASQVRQPIYSSSVEKWRKYEKHLTPLIAALKKD